MILFRPNFCANCGEKIERVDWYLWSSRRFCELCATEFQVQEYAPRIIVGIAVLAIVSTAAGYFGGSNRSDTSVVKRLSPQRVASQSSNAAANVTTPAANISPSSVDVSAQPPTSRSFTGLSQNKPPPIDKNGANTDAYFCGAETKKGTACSRRVKGNIRCYQHVGMPSILAAEKLKITQ